jgi:tRNA(fMet)-specific endonuclease VapC
MICLDTNIVIQIVNGRSSSLRHRLGEQMRAGAPIALPVIALFEMRYGFAKSDRREHNERLLERFLGLGIDLLPFEPEDAAHAGDIRAWLESKGTPIGHYDYLIAAQARRRGATLVTANIREFARVPGLLVADWVA